MNLYELNDQYKAIQEMDLDPEVMRDTLAAIKDSREAKLDNIANWIEQLKGDIDFYGDKIKSLQKAKRHDKTQMQSLMQYMTDVLDDAGIKKLHTENHILSTRNYKQGVDIDKMDKLPNEFIKHKEVTAPDKKAIYKALKSGQDVPGAKLVPNRKTLIN